MKAVSVQTVKVERGDATTMTTSSTSTTTTKTNPQIQTVSKATNENLLKIYTGKTNINENEKEKDTVKQNSTDNIKGNKNAEKEVPNTQGKEHNRKARTTKNFR